MKFDKNEVFETNDRLEYLISRYQSVISQLTFDKHFYEPAQVAWTDELARMVKDFEKQKSRVEKFIKRHSIKKEFQNVN